MFWSLFNQVTGLKACIFIKKESPTKVFSCEYCKIFLWNISSLYFSEIYVMVDIRYFKVLFYSCQIRPRNRKNFTIDRWKLWRDVFFSTKVWVPLQGYFLPFNHFVFTEIWKELKLQRKTSSSNWTILVSNFSKYI